MELSFNICPGSCNPLAWTYNQRHQAVHVWQEGKAFGCRYPVECVWLVVHCRAQKVLQVAKQALTFSCIPVINSSEVCQNNRSYTQLSHYFLSISGISNVSIIVATHYFFLYLCLILAAIPISYYFSSYHYTFSLFFPD